MDGDLELLFHMLKSLDFSREEGEVKTKERFFVKVESGERLAVNLIVAIVSPTSDITVHNEAG
ncbi:MAG: hypothetical protein CBC04_06310 [Verrucomicrobia bacterium TMED44]|nr:MAG: hypothetical protein CBC04_06310 [Verrucomicrobia bacterium TMED44]